MKQLINELEGITSEIIDRIEMISYEEVESFVEKRQRVVDSILVEVLQNRMDSEDEQRLKVLLSKDEIIVNKMIDLKKEAQDWLQQRNRIKAQRNAYENPYSADSLLLDRRK